MCRLGLPTMYFRSSSLWGRDSYYFGARGFTSCTRLTPRRRGHLHHVAHARPLPSYQHTFPAPAAFTMSPARFDGWSSVAHHYLHLLSLAFTCHSLWPRLLRAPLIPYLHADCNVPSNDHHCSTTSTCSSHPTLRWYHPTKPSHPANAQSPLRLGCSTAMVIPTSTLVFPNVK